MLLRHTLSTTWLAFLTESQLWRSLLDLKQSRDHSHLYWMLTIKKESFCQKKAGWRVFKVCSTFSQEFIGGRGPGSCCPNALCVIKANKQILFHVTGSTSPGRFFTTDEWKMQWQLPNRITQSGIIYNIIIWRKKYYVQNELLKQKIEVNGLRAITTSCNHRIIE